MPRRENPSINPSTGETRSVREVKYRNYIGIKVDPELKKVLRDISSEMGITTSELIRKAIVLYLWNILPVLSSDKRKRVVELTAGERE